MPVHGIDHLELYVGNAAQAAFYFTHAFGFTETAYMRPRDRAAATASRTCSSRGASGSWSPGALSGEDEIGEHHTPPRRRRAQDRAERARRRGRLLRTRSSTARAGCVTPHWIEDEHGRGAARLGRHLRRHASTCSWSAAATTAPSCPASRRATRRPRDPLFAGIDHVVGQRGARPHGGVGRATTSASSA